MSRPVISAHICQVCRKPVKEHHSGCEYCTWCEGTGLSARRFLGVEDGHAIYDQRSCDWCKGTGLG